ncbi:hypothetical protein HPB47_000502 [Ixodes persulcatus]|uniref:Uncharacterized protein n=1 Tax=Ixodes persulcatus TaxID=34615 RepID=A0AC60PSU3_IXOPE|nr:hypothetical protein HPB47_000502 [Ixodes persulcatus]
MARALAHLRFSEPEVEFICTQPTVLSWWPHGREAAGEASFGESPAHLDSQSGPGLTVLVDRYSASPCRIYLTRGLIGAGPGDAKPVVNVSRVPLGLATPS